MVNKNTTSRGIRLEFKNLKCNFSMSCIFITDFRGFHSRYFLYDVLYDVLYEALKMTLCLNTQYNDIKTEYNLLAKHFVTLCNAR